MQYHSRSWARWYNPHWRNFCCDYEVGEAIHKIILVIVYKRETWLQIFMTQFAVIYCTTGNDKLDSWPKIAIS